MWCLPSPPPPVEAWLLRGELQVAAPACAGRRLAGRCARLVSGGATPQHLQLVLLQPRGFPCTRPSLLSAWLASLTMAGGMQIAQALMSSNDKIEGTSLGNGLPVGSSQSWSIQVEHYSSACMRELGAEATLSAVEGCCIPDVSSVSGRCSFTHL